MKIDPPDVDTSAPNCRGTVIRYSTSAASANTKAPPVMADPTALKRVVDHERQQRLPAVDKGGVHTDLRALLREVEPEIVQHPVKLGAGGRISAKVHLDIHAFPGPWLDINGPEFSL